MKKLNIKIIKDRRRAIYYRRYNIAAAYSFQDSGRPGNGAHRACWSVEMAICCSNQSFAIQMEDWVEVSSTGWLKLCSKPDATPAQPQWRVYPSKLERSSYCRPPLLNDLQLYNLHWHHVENVPRQNVPRDKTYQGTKRPK